MYNRIQLNIDKEIKSYFLGFLFSVVLTVLPFLLVMQKIFSSDLNYIIILICAISQIVVHFLFFLHLNFSTIEGQWNIVALLFVIIIIFIVVFGSIWIMFNLNHHMLLH
ncbi:cytochrome o ubiquinol oxidase subunit IV [Buchnera aphidicola]|uniref:Cytochrome bo(3) ubiquinol oxidase subunit 4 n=1 Tax=Buchnera aphidicola str. USDA (Myzus persicae) TaxID=1009856 RepID=W0P4C1_BUCMP|nr:cytochrome o ubiquinol oxidase subunit IV [Buchnera aphidicola]AHG59928.1 Cyod [Buchnera aphidicola str. USDA (Myzus persicae)]AHG60508.1 Cyod [Buchnera aphidicola str. W106 (Myzus persicae)]AHG61081.1 Cyod [Buchnera aphidicola str. G002 (Myzus persicae)]AHG61653.1 Cyod [Buchnera aphidicola str. F009 (Myzus persicae)]WAI03385.1 MAG: cytochrome o ubiquinol oxidase subunit IV [Buchnera aphidicola (Myzus persicae)]